MWDEIANRRTSRARGSLGGGNRNVGDLSGPPRQALALATELEMRPLVAHCHLGVGQLYRRLGDRAKRDESLRIAITMYREMDMGFWLDQAEAALGSPL